MPTKSRYLITTADERTWKFDQPVVFLGEWCRLYDRKHIWQKMDAVVADPYGLNEGQKEKDLEYVMGLSKKLLDEVTDALNLHHNTCYSGRYWHIVIGHWLALYTTVLFNRYRTLESVKKNINISSTFVIDCPETCLSTPDLLAFISACEDDDWNYQLNLKIIHFLDFPGINVDTRLSNNMDCFVDWDVKNSSVSGCKNIIRQITANILAKFSKKTDAFIINSSFPLKEDIKLQLAFGQCPQLWSKIYLKPAIPALGCRPSLKQNAKNNHGFEQFIRMELFEIMPSCYIEGYGNLVEQIKSVPWPTNPRFILTAFNFFADEIFKVWAASKTEEGVPYFVLQHGNNYGTTIGSLNYQEMLNCDKFFTWGWVSDDRKNISAFPFKLANRKQRELVCEGGVLLIEQPLSPRIDTWDSYFEYGIFQEDQFQFVESLPQVIQESLTVRLHGGQKSQRWSDIQRWQERHPSINVETGLVSIESLMNQSRWVVHAYDSTGILETFALNVPTLCFWKGGLDHLLPSAKPYYERLKRVGILQDSPEKAAEMIALHWDDVNGWWLSQPVQHARFEFCQQFSRMVNHPVKTMKRLLIEHERV